VEVKCFEDIEKMKECAVIGKNYHIYDKLVVLLMLGMQQ
jgi:hypothetical protein